MGNFVIVMFSFLLFVACNNEEHVQKDDSKYVIINQDTIQTKDLVGLYSIAINKKKKDWYEKISFVQLEFRKDGICEIGGFYPLIGLSVKTYYKIEKNQVFLKDPVTNEWSEPSELADLMKDLRGNGTIKLTK